MDSNSKHFCLNCRRSNEETDILHMMDTGRLDTLCVDCRFAEIDQKHSSRKGIRLDMIRQEMLAEDNPENMVE